MFYTLMNRYIAQQLQQLQVLQAQQSQFLAWQYQQLQAWQQLLVNATLANQRFWQHNQPFSRSFVPFSLPFMQYSVRMQSYSTPSPTATTPVLKDVTPIQPPATATASSPSDTRPAPAAEPISTATTEPNTHPQSPDSVINPTKKTATVSETPTTAAHEPKRLVPPELIHEPPQDTEVSPPQAEIPQPIHDDKPATTPAPTAKPAATKTTATKPKVAKPAPAKTAQLKPTRTETTPVKAAPVKTTPVKTSQPKPTSPETPAASAKMAAINKAPNSTTTNKTRTKKSTAKAPQTKLADAQNALLQQQAKHSDLPAGATLTTPAKAMMTNAPISELPSITPVSAIEQALTPVDIIDLNTASETELVRLDGITSRRAQDIIAYRDTVAPFASIDELVNVKGIGQSTVDKNRHLITVGNTKADKS